jgi:16S rRNA (guanine527-N7)-methyltransferase
VSLVESSARKCAFMRAAIAAAHAGNAKVICSRAEDWTDGRGGCDLVTARALAALPVAAEYAAPLLRIGGALVVWRGRRDPAAEAAAKAAADELGLQADDPVSVRPYPAAEHRNLHLFRKIAETPARFPRRPGVAIKRPLGRRAAGGSGRLTSDRLRR